VAYVLVCAVALAASALTLLSGFGLGTLLLPAFALVLPAEVAVAATAIIHLLNNVFKLFLVGRHAKRTIVLALGLPAVPAALAGAWLLSRLAALGELARYELAGRVFTISPLDVAIALLIGAFALLELTSAGDRLAFPPRMLPLGGVAMGFFGGLSGHQGALRSAFLIRCGLTKEAFIGTGVACAVIVDVTRILAYGGTFLAFRAGGGAWLPLIVAATASALAGAWAGARLLRRVTLGFVRRLVGVLLLLTALGLGTGLI
jgi:uncharacterized membrane protein YfcA